MATILFAWELGAGLGHIMQFGPLANGLVGRGHRVFCSLRELRNAAGAFDPAVRLIPAPFRTGPPAAVETTRNFADVLRDVTFETERMLASHVAAWRNLYELVRPDLIVFDHAPTALLAARGLAVRRLVIGVGYCCPPDVRPFPQLAVKGSIDPSTLIGAETEVLDRANRVLAEVGERPLERLGQLYGEVDATLLMTFPELDPYARHRAADARVWGAAVASGGAAPQWPRGEGRKIYCYLRKFPALAELLEFLRDRGLPTLIFGDIDARLREQFASTRMAFATERLDPAQVAAECDLAVMNSGHGSVASILLAGKPSLQLPLYQEQVLNARAVRLMGAGLDASVKDAPSIIEKLKVLVEDQKYGEGAKRFADRHGWFDIRRQREEMLKRVSQLI